MKELKVSLRVLCLYPKGIGWNPVKELKVEPTAPIPSLLAVAWNPVKELKDVGAGGEILADVSERGIR